MRTASHVIRTPEGITFSQSPAGPVPRFFAWLVDLICLIAMTSLLKQLLGMVAFFSFGISATIEVIGMFVLGIGYGIALEWLWRGQTIGKRIFRLRVVDIEGMKLQFNQIVMRNLLRVVDSLPIFYFVGGVACWLSSKCQRLGDLAANTIVIHITAASEPDLSQILAGKYNSLRDYPHLLARLRKNVTPAEADVALRTLLRRDEFEPSARIEIFEELAAHFRAATEFPPEATDGLADEQYIRNVVDVLYRTQAEKRVEKTAAT